MRYAQYLWYRIVGKWSQTKTFKGMASVVIICVGLEGDTKKIGWTIVWLTNQSEFRIKYAWTRRARIGYNFVCLRIRERQERKRIIKRSDAAERGG